MIDFDVQLFPAGVRVPVTAPTVLEAADMARDCAGIAVNWAHVRRLTPLGRLDKSYWIGDQPTRVRFTDDVRAAVHFIGFRDPQQWENAARIYGQPDFVHYVWDQRARREIADGDVLVFAVDVAIKRDADGAWLVPKYDPAKPSQYNFDDSNEPDDPANKERTNARNHARSAPTFFPWVMSCVII